MAVVPSGPAASTRSARDADTPSAEEGDQKEQSGAEDTGHLWLPDPGDDADPMTLEQFTEEIKDTKKSYQMLQRLWNIVRDISTTIIEKMHRLKNFRTSVHWQPKQSQRQEEKDLPNSPTRRF